MDFRQILYFVSVAENKSFTRAAETLHISQPALSKAVQSLEKELGNVLIQRTSKYFELTPFGNDLYKECEKLVAEYIAIENRVLKNNLHLSGTIRCGIPAVLNTILAPYILGGFTIEYPDIRIAPLEAGSINICSHFSDYGLDVGLVLGPINNNNFNLKLILSDVLSLVVRKEHMLARKESVDVMDLKGEKLSLLNSEFQLNSTLISACREKEFFPQIVLESASWDFLIQSVVFKYGATVLPRPILRNLPDGLVQVPFNNSIRAWDIFAITPKYKTITSITDLFIDYLQKVLSLDLIV